FNFYRTFYLCEGSSIGRSPFASFWFQERFTAKTRRYLPRRTRRILPRRRRGRGGSYRGCAESAEDLNAEAQRARSILPRRRRGRGGSYRGSAESAEDLTAEARRTLRGIS